MKQLLFFLLITLVLSHGENTSIEERDIVPGGRSIVNSCLFPEGEIVKTTEIHETPKIGNTPGAVSIYRTDNDLTYISCIHCIDLKSGDRRYSGAQVNIIGELEGRSITISFNNRRSRGLHYLVVIKVVTRITTILPITTSKP